MTPQPLSYYYILTAATLILLCIEGYSPCITFKTLTNRVSFGNLRPMTSHYRQDATTSKNHLIFSSPPSSRRSSTLFSSSSSSSSSSSNEEEEHHLRENIDREHSSANVTALEMAVDIEEDKERVSIKSKFKTMFTNKDDESGMSMRQKLAKMGLSALLSYGFVSNMTYAVSVSLAYYGFAKKTGLSPLAPGQWKPFLAVYAGFYVFNNIIRPVRFAVAVGVTKYFDKAIDFWQRKANCSRPVAIALTVFFANIVGTTGAMALGISLASAASGVPVFSKKTAVVSLQGGF